MKALNIVISNSSGKPIYEQITNQVKAAILSGELSPGDALPSMRLLAKARARGVCGNRGGQGQLCCPAE